MREAMASNIRGKKYIFFIFCLFQVERIDVRSDGKNSRKIERFVILAVLLSNGLNRNHSNGNYLLFFRVLRRFAKLHSENELR